MRKIRRIGVFDFTNTYLSSRKLRGTSRIRGQAPSFLFPECHRSQVSALCSSARNFSCIGNNRILLMRGRGGAEDGNDLKTSPNMMTPLGHDPRNDEDIDTSKKTDGNEECSQYRIFDKFTPKTFSEWVQVALSIRGKDEKVLVCVGPEKADLRTKIGKEVVRFVTTNENERNSEEGALAILSHESSPSPPHQPATFLHHILEQESTDSVTGEKNKLFYTPMTRLECMLTALRNDILSLFPSGASGGKAEPLSAENSQSQRDDKGDLSNYWNMLGGMFNSKVPFVRVLKNLDATRSGANALTITPLLCYTRAVELRPDSANAWNNLGAEIAQNGPVEGHKLNLSQHNSEITADACFRKAVELKPDYVGAWFNLFLCDKPSVSLRLPQPASTASATTTDSSIENDSEAIHVSRDDCYVKALTVAREDSYSLFLTGKGLLELPASRGGHFKDYVETQNGLRVAREPFNVEKAIVKTLEKVISTSPDLRVGEKNVNGRERDVCVLQFDTLALWYYAAECLEYNKDQQRDGNRRASDAPDAERTLCIAGSEFTAKDCLVSALEVEARRQAVFSAAPTKGSPFIPLVWEALSKHVKGDGATVTIAGHTFTAEEVFTNQFES